MEFKYCSRTDGAAPKIQLPEILRRFIPEIKTCCPPFVGPYDGVTETNVGSFTYDKVILQGTKSMPFFVKAIVTLPIGCLGAVQSNVDELTNTASTICSPKRHIRTSLANTDPSRIFTVICDPPFEDAK